jgi:hypothetical protein
VPVRLYSAAKTVADCLKYRDKISEDVAENALREFRRQHPDRTEDLESYAGICRVTRGLRRCASAA